MDTIANRFGRPQRVSGQDFAGMVYFKWGMGTRDCQPNLLIVVERSASQVCAAGSGLDVSTERCGSCSWLVVEGLLAAVRC